MVHEGADGPRDPVSFAYRGLVCSTVRWRRPTRKFGTDSVLSMAVLSVTVTIVRRSGR
jgi:hypothetical protein